MILHDAAAGLLAGLLSVFLVIYAFQPDRLYPAWVLEPAESPWIFLVLFVVAWFLFKWDYTVGILTILCLIALVLDIVVFSRDVGNEGLYVPSIDLVPGLQGILTAEGFENQKNVPVVLQKEEQVSKRWAVNREPDPYLLRENAYVDGNDVYESAMTSGVPLSDASLRDSYPLTQI